MPLEQVKKLDPKGRLVYWIRERESIRLKKLQGLPKPWTNDKILSSFRFCNVRRLDDKVSDWLLLNWYQPFFNHKNMVIAAVLARHFNQPSTLARIGFPEGKFIPNAKYVANLDWYEYIHDAKAAITSIKLRGDSTAFNNAYIIRADGKFPNKVDMVFDETVQQFVDDPPDLNTDSMEMCVEELMHYRNIGSFMAGQICADLRWA